MEPPLKEPAACVDDALESCGGSAVGWDSAVDYVQGASVFDTVNLPDPGVKLRGVLPLPAAFTSQYSTVRYKSFMGLFPEINRAWLTVDERVFLWGYSADSVIDVGAPHDAPGVYPGAHRADDFYSYEGFDQIIVSVGLVHPRAGVFVDEVEYLLAVATSVEVTLLGVTFSGPNKTGEISLIPTNISVATDNVLMLKISSTPEGRIFMAGADGSLHEFVYQGEQQRWMMGLLPTRPKKRVRKVVHNSSSIAQYLLPASVTSYFSREDELVDLVIDPTRNALYTLSQAGNLTVYDISEKESLKSVKSVSVAHESRYKLSLSIPAADREYVAIFPVPPNLSSAVHLIVVTSFGERIYFSTASPTNYARATFPHSSTDGDLRPRNLHCTGYRPWPGGNTNVSPRPCVHMAWWNNGALVLADLRDSESDRLMTVFPDSTTGGRTALASSRPTTQSVEIVFETSASVPVDRPYNPLAQETDNAPTRSFAIAEVQTASPQSAATFSTAFDKVPLDTPRYFWVLTTNAMHMYERVPPLTRLQEILAANGGSDSEIRAFFARFGTAEVCAMCIKLAITNSALAPAAARLFYTFGGNPAALEDPAAPNGNGGHRRSASVSFPMDMEMSAPAGNRGSMVVQSGSVDHNSPSMPNHFDVGRPAVQSVPTARFSGAHDGTSLYIAQVVFPLWNEYLTSSRDPDGYQALASSRQTISAVRDELLSLVAFFERYAPEVMLPSLTNGKSSPPGAGVARPEATSVRPITYPRASPMEIAHPREGNGGGNFQDKLYRGLFQMKKTSEVRRAETAAINALKGLALRCAEACSLIVILAEHQLHRLVPRMPVDCKHNLVKMRLCDLVAAEVGIVVSTALLESLFATYADGANAVSTIGHVLHQQCSTFFGDADIAMHRGLALLRQAVARVNEIAESVPEGDGTAIMHDASLGLLDGGATAASDRAQAVQWAEQAAEVLKSAPERLYDLPGICADFELVGTIPVLIDVALTAGSKAESMGDRERAKVAYTCILDALNPLVHEAGDDGMGGGEGGEQHHADEGSSKRLKDACMRVALSSNSDMFLQTLYEFLLKSKSGEAELLNRPSPGVRRFLEEKGDRSLLWRYFAGHGENLEAAVILLNLAEDPEDKPLVDRLNFLSCAMHNAKTAASSGDPRAEALLSELSDFMDVAKVQLRVRDELTQRHARSAEVTEALKELNGAIMDLTKLFNQFARPFELLEAQLDAFRCGSYRDDAYVRSLWHQLLQREAASASHTPAVLYQKLVAVGKSFYPSDVAFPIEYIVEVLEHYVLDKVGAPGWQGESGWVSRLMKEIGVPVGEIVDAYRNMIESPMQRPGITEGNWSWTDEGAQLHLMRATERALAAWIENTPGEREARVGDLSRRSLLSEYEKALRGISLCKSRLRGMSGGAAAGLIQRFEMLEKIVATQT